MITVGVYYSNENSLPEQNDSTFLYDATRDLFYEIESLGARPVLLADQDSYLGASHFSHYWGFEKQQGTYKSNETIKPDVVLKKANLKCDSSLRVINHPELYSICQDKYLMSRMFKDLCPTTILVSNESELPKKLPLIKGDIKVLKSTQGSYSQQVTIGTDEEIMNNQVPYPAILQEMIDSTNGIPGLTPSEHDLRVMMIDSVPSLIILRTPKNGEHRAGLRMGASAYFPDETQLPLSVKQLIYEVDSHFAEYPGRVYSIDCALTPGGPKIIELNKSPALWPSKENRHIDIFNKKLAQHLVGYATKDKK